MEKVKLSVIVLTKNEEGNIKDCLESVYLWADEIIVVDDGSTDRTVEIAQRYADKVLFQKMDVEGRHRNWAQAQARNDWVLNLDADERPTEALKEEIAGALKAEAGGQESEFAAFTIPRRNLIGNYWLRWGGEYPCPQLKLFKKDRLKWEEVYVHPRAFLQGSCGHLKNDIIHYSWSNFGDYLSKINSQSSLEAKKWHELSLVNSRKARYKMNLVHALWRMLDRFVRRFFAKRGYRDGFYGFMVACFDSLYQIISYAKYCELQKK